MKQTIKIFLLGAIAALSMTSCDDPVYPNIDNGEGFGTGSLKTASLSVSVLNSEEVLESRAGVDVSNFTVKIINGAGETVNTWLYSKMPEIVTLNVGKYTLEVYNEECKDAEWDSPYYYASKEFPISKNDVSTIGEVVCKLANVKVSVKYSDALKAALGDDVNVNVVVGNQYSLDYKYGEERAGFFRYIEGSSTLVATFSGTVEGYYISDYKVISDVAPGQHRIITFSLKSTPDTPDESGSIGNTGLSLDFSVDKVDLTLDNPVTEDPVDPDDMLELGEQALSFTNVAGSKTVTITSTGDWTATSNASWCTVAPASGAKGTTTVTVNVTENESMESGRSAVVTFRMGDVETELTVTQAPKPDETAPTITSETLDLSSVNTYTESLVAKVLINAPNGIAHLNVVIDSETLTPAELESVELCDRFDLVDPQYPSNSPYYGNPDYAGVLNTKLSALGFPTQSNVAGQTSLEFDITGFLPMLKALGSGQSNFVLEVVDAKGQIVSAAIRINIPE